MAAPTSYTESSLAAFMVTSLGEVAAALGWTALAQVQEAVNDSLLMLGVSSVDQATDIPKLRAAARLAVWRQAVASLSARFDFEADQQVFKRSQVATAARAALANAEADAMEYGLANWNVETTPLRHIHDPYSAQLLDEERVLT